MKLMKLYKIVILKLLAIVTLLSALLALPYVYYQLLRWFISLLSLYLAYLCYQRNNKIWIAIFSVIAILFNPIAPIYLKKESWAVIDIIVAIIFGLSLKFTSNSSELLE
ncbi:DUF6804 family protein [Candidatus Margulisiibacteriota bacterium]